MDLEIKLLRKKLIDLLNDSNLPMEVKRLLLAEILAEVKEATDKVIQEQIAEYNNNKESEVTENGN